MRNILGLALLGTIITSPAWAEQPLSVVYPPAEHQTTAAERIFFIGTAPSAGEVLVNGKAIARSQLGILLRVSPCSWEKIVSLALSKSGSPD
jgi:N-acetylmuramoyl-L-alanine amidase